MKVTTLLSKTGGGSPSRCVAENIAGTPEARFSATTSSERGKKVSESRLASTALRDELTPFSPRSSVVIPP